MLDDHPRIAREKKTVQEMIKVFCRRKHGSKNEFCSECSDLLDYALFRLDKCSFQEKKPTCAKCPIHCYDPIFRAKIRSVMKYSGPRMLFKHPILALHHLFDGNKKNRKSV